MRKCEIVSCFTTGRGLVFPRFFGGMIMKRTLPLFSLLIFNFCFVPLAFSLSADRETITHCRCPENETIVVDMSRERFNSYQIKKYCGKPHRTIDYGQEEHYEEVKKTGDNATVSRGTVSEGAKYEEWVYEWDSRRYILFFLFKDLELIRIQRLDKEAF